MDRIFVTVRAKPISPDDAKSSPWRISGNSISLLNYPSKFDFDRVFGEDCRTREVYDVRTKEIVASAVRGFNGTVFAYGQTSSGKTYTMRGLAGEPGIIPLAIHDLFQSIQEHTDREFLVRVSYMEIYNEEINDLLAPEHRKLQIHESIERGIFVAGLKEEIVTCPEQVLDLMEFGESHRHIGETNMNFHSSRSHTIFRMIIESRDRRDDDDSESCDAIRVSILNLVDLAGSERVVKTGAEGMRLKEGSHINKSLLTLGTVIKKLSEGVESQGGHVPYRDSKLTRILQSALGGNANTAIICNITLAQIHTDETKSTLQFASRALRVSNCAHVNEILTDAALLKRQKKEIEELRARLQGSHMEHWEEEILNLRNTLLQSELEKERITLELEEEKKDKAQREKRLNEKIANLSSMFLYSKRDGDAFLNQEKRRNTWCPGASLDKPANTDSTIGTSMVQESHDAEKSENGASFQPSFEELLEENVKQDIHTLPCLESKHDPGDTLSPDNFCFLDKHALMHVTNRRKAQRRNTSSPVRAEMDVLFEAKEKLFENPSTVEGRNCALSQTDTIFYCGSTVKTCIESELSLGFSQLCNQKTLLVPEKASQQKNFDGTFKDTQVANFEENMDKVWQSLGMESELHLTMDTVSSMSLIVDETIQDFLMLSKFFMELRASTTQDVQQLKSIIQGHDQIYHCMLSKADDLETEKSFLLEGSVESSRIIDGLKLELESCKEMLDGKVSEYDLEKEDLLRQILELQREVTHLSSSSLARENEGLRKDLEKTRTKLKETDSKFKNAVQEKSRLEAEKAHNEREIKHLIGQRALLERDISRRESLIEKKNDVRPSDFNKVKGHIGPSEHVVQMECQRLELHVSELESTIMALEEQYLLVVEEKEELFSRQSTLDDELEAATDKLNAANIALENLQEENLKSQQYESRCKELEYLTEMMLREKEEMGIQLTDALLELEAEKSTRLCAEKDLTDGRGKIVLLEESIATLTTNLAQAKMEFEAYNQECHILREKLSLSEDHLEQERQQRTAEIARLRSHIAQVQINNSKNEEALEEKYRILLLDISRLQADINVLSGERDMLSLQLNEKNMAYSPTVFEDALRSKENLKLRMRLHSTQEKLDMCRGRYKEVSRDMSIMHKKYEEASANLKKQLADYGMVILQLKKELQLGGGCSRNC